MIASFCSAVFPLLSYILKLFFRERERDREGETGAFEGAIHDSSLRCVWGNAVPLNVAATSLVNMVACLPALAPSLLFDEALQVQPILEVSSGACAWRGGIRSNAAGLG